MTDHFTIKRNPDRLHNSRINVMWECAGIYAATWLVLLIGPVMASRRSMIRHNGMYTDFIGDLYKDPSTYYIWFFMISAVTTFIYIIIQCRYTKIVEISIREDEWIFKVTNRFGLKFRNKPCRRADIIPKLNKTKHDETLGLTFYLHRDIHKIGHFRFNDFSRLSKEEQKLIEVTFS